MSAEINIFDRNLVRRRRDRAAADLTAYDFLYREIASRLVERLEDITRSFPSALDLGCHGGVLAEQLGDRGGVQSLVQSDLSPAMAQRAAKSGPATFDTAVVAADEEFLPFAKGSFDLVFSSLALHWVNDLPGALIQIAQALRPDGLFLGALFGGETLHELRAALLEAELAEEGGASPHISPFADIRDAGSLLQRAGFALPVADSDSLTVTYANAMELMRDLRSMGQSNALRDRRRHTMRRRTLLRAAEIYGRRFATSDGRVHATFEVIYLTAWAAAASQPRPLAPGSARARLADALGTEEHKTGDKPRGS